MTAANIRLHFFSLSTQVSDNLKTNKRLFLSANFRFSFPKIYCSRRRSSGRITSPPVDLSIDKLEADGCSVSYNRWKSVAKRKVAMRVGYVGTNYKGLQIQRDSASTVTIEGELERAILKAGGMLESNYGNLHKIGWRRSSRTDKGVHSLATVITLKLEVPDGAWVDDPDGTQLAEAINQHLPYNVRVFSILPINKGFDARIDCASRKYMYLLPAEVIGIENNCSTEEIEHNVREFRDILQIFKIRKMVGTAVAVRRGLLPRDVIKISLSRHSRIVLPLAPSEVLVLSGNEFYIPEKFRSWGIPSNSVPVRSEISRLTGSDSIQDRVDDFYSTVLLPELANYLDPLLPLWNRWLERLDMSAIPHEEMNEVRRAWIQWQENHFSRKQEVS